MIRDVWIKILEEIKGLSLSVLDAHEKLFTFTEISCINITFQYTIIYFQPMIFHWT